MIWWFLILAVGAGAVLWAAVAAYLGVRRHMKSSAVKKGNIDREPDTL
jgi:hypothetical protein